MICCKDCNNYIMGNKTSYWEWRTYKHQQGSLVWKPKQFETISFYYYLMIMRVFINSSPTVSFKVS